MQSQKNPFSGFHMFEDLTKMATGTVSTIFDAKKEVEHLAKHNVEKLLGAYNLVTREEYDVVKEMAAKARENQESLEKRVQELEAKLAKVNQDVTKLVKPTAASTSKTEVKKVVPKVAPKAATANKQKSVAAKPKVTK
jgi:BMFP domain-containing protein YqiC